MHKPRRKRHKKRYFGHRDPGHYTQAGPVTITKASGEVEVRAALNETEFQRIVKVRAVSKRTREKIIRRDGCCRYCRTKTGPWEIDHVVPVSMGGTNRLGNLVLACSDCNQRKKTSFWIPNRA